MWGTEGWQSASNGMTMWGYLPPANFIEHNPRKLAEIASDETETPGL